MYKKKNNNKNCLYNFNTVFFYIYSGLPDSDIQDYYENLSKYVFGGDFLDDSDMSDMDFLSDEDDFVDNKEKPPTDNIIEPCVNRNIIRHDCNYSDIVNYFNELITKLLNGSVNLDESLLESQPILDLTIDSTSQESTITDENNETCDYLEFVQIFQVALNLSMELFPMDSVDICFCENCAKNCPNYMKDWVYFKIHHKHGDIHLENSSLDWLLMYYKANMTNIRTILDTGYLLPNSTITTGTHNSNCQQHTTVIEKHTELYLTLNEKAFTMKSGDRFYTDGDFYRIRIALEVYVKRQSLCADINVETLCNIVDNDKNGDETLENVGEPSPSTSRAAVTATTTTTTDSNANSNLNESSEEPIPSTSAVARYNTFDPDLQKWFTKDLKACKITALLLKMEKVTRIR